MGKKRILVFTESYLPSIGGLENNTALLCQSLTDLGHQVTLLTPQKNALLNINYKIIESRSLNQYLNQVINNELIIVNGGIAFKIIAPCLILFKPYIVIYQMASLFQNIHANNLKIKITNRIRKFFAAVAKYNVGVSRYSYQELINNFGEKKSKLLINPSNPIFQDYGTTEKSSESFECLIAGRLIEGKGIKLMVEAVVRLRAKKLPFNLHLIGDGPEKLWIQSKLHLGFIFLHAPATLEELKIWYKKVHLTIIPSTTHIEGSPLVMAESISMGTPVLVSSQNAMMASVRHEKLSFLSGDVIDLQLKLTSLLNTTNYKKIKKHCIELEKDYNYDNYINNLQKIINV